MAESSCTLAIPSASAGRRRLLAGSLLAVVAAIGLLRNQRVLAELPLNLLANHDLSVIRPVGQQMILMSGCLLGLGLGGVVAGLGLRTATLQGSLGKPTCALVAAYGILTAGAAYRLLQGFDLIQTACEAIAHAEGSGTMKPRLMIQLAMEANLDLVPGWGLLAMAQLLVLVAAVTQLLSPRKPVTRYGQWPIVATLSLILLGVFSVLTWALLIRPGMNLRSIPDGAIFKHTVAAYELSQLYFRVLLACGVLLAHGVLTAGMAFSGCFSKPDQQATPTLDSE